MPTESSVLFENREDAGTRLAAILAPYAGTNAVVFGLTRGGVEVGAAVARALHLQFRPLVVRKIGAPGNPELALGAISETGTVWLDRKHMRAIGATETHARETAVVEAREIERQQRAYGLTSLSTSINNRLAVAIVVDDGIATGSTARVAVDSLRTLGVGHIVVASPVASEQAIQMLRQRADDVVALAVPKLFRAVGLHYRNFNQVEDSRVRHLAAGTVTSQSPEVIVNDEPREVAVHIGGVTILGVLSVPGSPTGLVIFAHGSGSGRLSPRNQAVAAVLNDAGFATFLPDLLSVDEARDRRMVFDIPLLATRLTACAEWASRAPEVAGLPIAFFGASTGAGSALAAAADPSNRARAVVSRGGRVDLAARALEMVRCPTLLIVGEKDSGVVALNRHAYDRLSCDKRLIVVPGASHLFEETGALRTVAELARDWFSAHLRA